MSGVATLLALAASWTPAAPAHVPRPVPGPCVRCSYVTGGDRLERKRVRRARRRIRLERRRIEQAHWYVHRHVYTRPYRGWLVSTRSCESGGDYSTYTGNGFSGAYQFLPSTWYAVGGHGLPHLNPPLEQDYRAVILLRTSGAQNWPVCG